MFKSKITQRIVVGILCGILALTGIVSFSFAATDPTDISVTKKVTGNAPSEEYTFVLERDSADCPMPSGSDGNVKVLTINGEGTDSFGTIPIEEEGVYGYTVTEVAGNTEGMTYDSSEYKVQLVSAESGISCVIHEASSSEKPDKILFTNAYTAKATGTVEEKDEQKNDQTEEKPNEEQKIEKEKQEIKTPKETKKTTATEKPTVAKTIQDKIRHIAQTSDWFRMIGIAITMLAVVVASMLVARKRA